MTDTTTTRGRLPRWTFKETGAWLPHMHAGGPGRAIPFYQRIEAGKPTGPKLTRRLATLEARRAGAVAEFTT